MTCDDRGPDLVARLLGQLEPGEAADTDAHLEGCGACREEYARIEAASATLQASVSSGPPVPSEEGLERLLLAVQDEAAERRADAALAAAAVCGGRGGDLTALALGAASEVTPETRAELEIHLAECAPCASEFRTVKLLAGATRDALNLEPSEEGRARLLECVASEGPAPVSFEGVPALPPPRHRRRGPLRLFGWLLPVAAAASVLFVFVIGNGPGPAHVSGHGAGFLISEQTKSDPADKGRWVDATTGDFRFDDGDIFEAGQDPVTVRVDCDADGSASLPDGELARGAAEFTLEPGARIGRIDSHHFELVAGRVVVTANQLNDALELRSDDLYAIVRGTRFAATAVDHRMVVVVESGKVELGRRSGPAPRSIVLGAKEQGLVDAERLLRRPADGRLGGDAFLTPRASLEGPAAPVERGAAVPFRASLGVADAGPVSIAPFDDSLPVFAIRLKGPTPTGPEREVKIQESMLASPPPTVVAGGTWRLTSGRPYRLEVRVPGLDLEPGTWTARLRYMSYRPQSAGAMWLGVVESPPVSFEVSR